jgi:hypothetical protein
MEICKELVWNTSSDLLTRSSALDSPTDTSQTLQNFRTARGNGQRFMSTLAAMKGRYKSKKKKLRGLSPRANYTDRRLSEKLVPTFADRGCRVVSATDPHSRILCFLDLATTIYSK